MRKLYAIRNTILALLSQVLITLILFVNRKAFAVILGKAYLGVNGLFSDILGMLAVAELGIGTAIVFALYEPIAKNDTKRVGALINFYKKAYWIIGTIMAVAGIAIIPFLPYIVSDVVTIEHYRIIYLIVLANSIVTYFFSYKITIITVVQKSYIQNICTTIANFVQTIGQLFVLIITKNYIFYLIIQFVCTLAMNIVLSNISNRMYPEYFKKENMTRLGRDEQKSLVKNIKALFLHRIGTFLVKGTDNIIITMFLGLVSGGVYSNYNMIFSNISRYFGLCYNAITATVGNYNVTEEKSKTEQMFYNINFLSFSGSVLVTVVLLCATESFIALWLGTDYLDSFGVTVMLALTFYLSQVRAAIYVVKNAQGIFYEDRFKPIVESIVNLVVSVIFVKKFGVVGVLIGTFVSGFFVGLIVEIYVVYKYGFKSSPKPYLTKNLLYLLCGFFSAGISCFICGHISINNIFTLILRCVIASLVTLVIIFIMFNKSAEFKFFRGIILGLINKFWGRKTCE